MLSLKTHKRLSETADCAVAHAYIFGGGGTADREVAALEFAKALQCENQEERPCGHCISCKKVGSGNHEDVIHVRKKETA